ncbi:MAG: LacI family DNA-binding transcriptional regulator [Verrucomicrobiota bacterium]
MPTGQPNTTAALAKHLGISRWTVSRVLNGHSGVKPETLRKVKQAIEELGFQPSALARGLRAGKRQR